MISLLAWLDYVVAEVGDHPDADGLKEMASTLAYLADENGNVRYSAVEEHYGMEPGSLQEMWGDGEGIALRIPQ